MDNKPFINNFPKYGKNFWCLDKEGNMLIEPALPKLLPFFYKDKNGKLDGDQGWYLLEDFTILYKIKNIWYKITCKKNFDWDGASIPQFIRNIMGDKMLIFYIVASLYHDLFYVCHHEIISRDTADTFFHDVVGVYNGSFLRQDLVWSAVRTFGWIMWDYQEDKEITKQEKYKNFLIIEKQS